MFGPLSWGCSVGCGCEHWRHCCVEGGGTGGSVVVVLDPQKGAVVVVVKKVGASCFSVLSMDHCHCK